MSSPGLHSLGAEPELGVLVHAIEGGLSEAGA